MLTTLTIGGLSENDYAPMLARLVEIAAENGGEIVRTSFLKPWDFAFLTLKVVIGHPEEQEGGIREAFFQAYPIDLTCCWRQRALAMM